MASDTYKLTIVFSGLCAFVPRGVSEERLERMDVLLVKVPNLPEDIASGSEYGGYGDVPHQPILRFALKDLPGENKIEGDADGFWYLNDEDVSLSLLGDGEAPLTGRVEMRTGVRIPGSEKPMESMDWRYSLEDQEADISWLPELEKVHPEAATVNPDLLDGATPSPTVAARFRFGSGLLRSDRIATFNDGYVVAQFVPAWDDEAPYTQAIAHWVALEIEVDRRSSLLFKAARYGGGQERRLVLRPADGEAGLKVYVSNLCCGNFVYQDQSVGAGSEEVPSADLDFEHLYELSERFEENPDEIWPVPVPVKFPRGPWRMESGGSSGIKCTGGRFPVTPLGGGGR